MKEKVIWAVKHVVIFAVLYMISAVIVEGLVIAGFSSQGYHVLQGEFPEGYWVSLIPLYSAVMFLVSTLIYVKLIAKKKLSDIRLLLTKKALLHVIAGMLGGGFAVAAVILILTGTGVYQFAGYQGVNSGRAVTVLGAFLIQGAAEEVMCRGFLQNFLEKKISEKASVLIAALAFMAPHLLSLESDAGLILISICNLFAVSVVFSLAMLRWNSLWVPIGIHVGWNYFLSYVFGLQLSGMETGNNVFLFQTSPEHAWLHGGNYGVEAGIAVTVLLVLAGAVLYLRRQK